MRASLCTSVLTLALVVVVATPTALAQDYSGGQFIFTVQNGDWSAGSTWDIGSPPDPTQGHQTAIDHDLTITTAGVQSGPTNIGFNQPGSLAISAGDLTAGIVLVGSSQDGVCTLSGGQLTAQEVWVSGVGPDGDFTKE